MDDGKVVPKCLFCDEDYNDTDRSRVNFPNCNHYACLQCYESLLNREHFTDEEGNQFAVAINCPMCRRDLEFFPSSSKPASGSNEEVKQPASGSNDEVNQPASGIEEVNQQLVDLTSSIYPQFPDGVVNVFQNGMASLFLLLSVTRRNPNQILLQFHPLVSLPNHVDSEYKYVCFFVCSVGSIQKQLFVSHCRWFIEIGYDFSDTPWEYSFEIRTCCIKVLSNDGVWSDIQPISPPNKLWFEYRSKFLFVGEAPPSCFTFAEGNQWSQIDNRAISYMLCNPNQPFFGL